MTGNLRALETSVKRKVLSCVLFSPCIVSATMKSLPVKKSHPLKTRLVRNGFKLVNFAAAAGITPAELSRYLGGYESPRVRAAVESAVKKYLGNRLSA